MTNLCVILLVSFSMAVLAKDPSINLPIAIPMKRTTSTANPSVPNTYSGQTCKGTRLTCGSCNSVLLCNYNDVPVGSYDCASIDPKLPYCTGNGICGSKLDGTCSTKSDLCEMPSKYYPDPSNCTQAVYCDDKQNAEVVSSPSSSYVFNYELQSWSLRRSNLDCFEINCAASGKQNTWSAYKPYPNLSIYCASTGPMTIKCPQEFEAFNESKKRCELSCLSEGNYPHPDETKFYACLPSLNGKLQPFERSCPKCHIFKDKICVKSDACTPTNEESS